MKKLIIIIIIIALALAIYKYSKLDEVILKMIYPIKYSNYVETYSEKYDVDKYFIYAMIKAESNFNERALSNSKAIGLMQILEDTAFEMAEDVDLGELTEEELYNPDTNINLGVKYFSYLLKQFDNNYNLAIIAYNAGIGNVQKWIEQGIIQEDGSDLENVPFKETNNYVRKILNNYKMYEKIYEGK